MSVSDYVKGVMGKIETEQSFAIALWANRPISNNFVLHTALSEICTGQKPFILIDDYLPMAYFRRSWVEQSIINDGYMKALTSNSVQVCLMTSLISSTDYLWQIIKLSDKITFREFVRCLPEKKMVNGLDGILTSEILHTSAELFAFELLLSYGFKSVIIPQFAQAIMALHRNISASPLSAVVTANFVIGADAKQQCLDLWQSASELRMLIHDDSIL